MPNDWGDEAANDWGDRPASGTAPLASAREIAHKDEAPGFWRGVARGGYALPGLLGLDYETANAAENALRDPSGLSQRGLGLGERFRWYRDYARERSRMGETENPIRTGLGIGAGSAPSVALAPQARAAEGAGLASRAGVSALNAATQAAAVEGGVTQDVPLVERLKRMGVAAIGGSALGALAPAASSVAAANATGKPPIVKPSEAAEALKAKGVEGMTIGQQAPGSALAPVEEAATSLPIVGKGLEKMRSGARDSWRSVVMKEGVAPGAEVPKGNDVQGMLSDLYRGFEPAYAQIKGEPVSPSGLAAGFKAATGDPSVIAEDATRNAVDRFLSNELTRLPKPAEGQAGDAVPAEAMLKMRSAIRGASRKALAQGKFDAASLLDGAEQHITDTIGSQLSPAARKSLTNTDSAYARYKVIEDAVRRAGASGEFTPAQLDQAVRAATERGLYARGGGGNLRDLAQNGREVFDTRVPMTGARWATLDAIPGVGPAISGLVARGANLGPVQKALTEVKIPTSSAVPALRPVAGELAGSEAATRASSPLGLAAAAAGNEPAPVAPTPAPAQGEQGQNEKQPQTEPPAHGADLAPAGTLPQGEKAPERPPEEKPLKHVSTTDKLTGALQTNPAALGPYAGLLATRLRLAGPLGVSQADFLLQQRDPAYRAHRAQAIGDDRLSES